MASTTTPGSLTINDITLSVPPLEIVSQKDAANYEWQTLRTKNATKIPSHHGMLNISMSCVFVGQNAINNELRPIICQLRLTPICYVDNEFIRGVCAPTTTQASTSQDLLNPVLLIMKNMTLSFESSMPDTITVHFEFAWFNYLPYVHSLRFQKNFTANGISTPVTSPAQSPAWQAFYASDMANYKTIDFTSTPNLIFQFRDFLLAPNNTNPNKITGANGITQPPSAPPGYQVSQMQYPGISNSSPYQLLYKVNQVVVNNSNLGLINVGMTVSFENIISMVPIIGHTYATFQHLGAIDPRVIIRLNATSDGGHAAIQQMWNTLESTSIPFRHLPQANINLTVVNDFLQLCGVKEFLIDSLTDETIQGQVGNFAMTLSMRGQDFKVGEYLQQEYLTSESLRAAICNDMNLNINQVAGTGLPGSTTYLPVWFPTVVNTPDQQLLYSDLNSYCDLVNQLVNQVVSSVHDVIGNTQGYTSGTGIFATAVDLTSPNITLDLAVANIRNLLNYFAGNGNPEVFFSTFPELLPVNLAIQALGITDPVFANINAYRPTTGQSGTPFDPTSYAPLKAYDRGINTLCDTMTQNGSLNFPQFADALVLAGKIGAFTGRSAYPDFSTLSTVADRLKVPAVSIDPDFYFYTNTTNAISSAVDTWMYDEAVSWGQDLYVNGKTSYINQFNNYLQDTYLKRFSPENTAYSKLTTGATQRISKFPGQASKYKFIPSTNQAVGQYYNTLAVGKSLSPIVSQNIDPANASPAAGFITKANSAPIAHNADPGFIFGDVTTQTPPGLASTTLPNVQFTWPVNGPIAGEYHEARASYTANNGTTMPAHTHQGIDIAVSTATPIQATAAGTIENPGVGTGAAGLRIWVDHAGNYQSRYLHLSSIALNATTGLQFAEGDVVQQGTIIGFTGSENNIEHLHFEIYRNGQTIDPLSVLNNGSTANTAATGTQTNASILPSDSGEGAHSGNSLLARSVAALTQELANGQAERMIRAYPTFKLYFIAEQDYSVGSGGRFLGFDDFFNYNAVKSIRVVRSRKVPADLCVIELTNISGVLSNRSFRDQLDEFGFDQGTAARQANGQLANRLAALNNPKLVNTSNANPIASLMLEEGTKVWLKLGYSNDPARLEDVFLGQITEVEFSETDDLITIVCQAYTTELTQQLKGPTAAVHRGTNLFSGWFLADNDACTGFLLSDMLQSPEVQHFGRWIRSRLGGSATGNTNLPLLNNKTVWNPTPQDDNIFPPIADYDQFTSVLGRGFNWLTDRFFGAGNGAHTAPINYWIYKKTIWDIFKEMELRHPGCIASPVPYIDAKYGPRMTMFFGLPNQLYFKRDPTPLENTQNNQLAATVANNTPTGFNMLDPSFLPTSDFNNSDQTPGEPFDFNEFAAAPPSGGNTTPLQTAINQGTIAPFRQYHVLTSNNHIVENNLRCSSLDTYNTVSIQYSHLTLLADNEVAVQDNDLVSTDPDVFRLKADAGLPDETVREAFLTYPTCVGSDMAEYYALGALKNTLRDIYKGDIIVLGSPSIKPYDICYVFDEYTDMVGPIEVEAVTHVFSKETGFLTEITPDICVSINEWSTLTNLDAMGIVAEGVISGLFKSQVTKSTPAPATSTNNQPVEIVTGVSPSKIASLVQGYGTGSLMSGAVAQDGQGSYSQTPAQIALAQQNGQSIPNPLTTLGAVGATGVTVVAIAAPEVVAVGAIVGVFALSKYVSWSQYLHPITLVPVHYKGRPLVAAMGSKTIDQNWWTRLKRWYNNGVQGATIFEQDLGDYLTINPNVTLTRTVLAGNTQAPTFGAGSGQGGDGGGQ